MSTLKVNAIRQTAASSDAVTLAADGTCTAKITNNLSNRNLIINGAMQIAQRGTSFADPSDGTYVMDRWKIRNPTGTPAITWTKDSESPDGFASSLKCDCTTADTSLAAGEFTRIEYHAEGQDLQAFAKGTSSAKKGILSFYVKTNKTGVYVVNMDDADNSRNFSASYTVSDSNWNRYTISIPADTTGAWGNDNGGSLEIDFGLAIGSTRNSGDAGDLPTAWGAHASNTQFAGQVNFVDSTSNDFYITGVQLEIDSTGSGVATDFEHRTYPDELIRCQRYYQVIAKGSEGSSGTHNPIVSGAVYSDNSFWYGVARFQTKMRTGPTLDVVNGTDYYGVYRGGGIDLCDDVAVNNESTDSATIRFGGNFSGTRPGAGWARTNHASAFVAFSAEL